MAYHLGKDLRFAARALARRPSYLAAGVLTLALAIGASSLIFCVAESTLLRPLPYAEPDDLLAVWSQWIDFPKTWVSAEEYALYRDQVASFGSMAMYSQEWVTLGGEAPERVAAAAVTSGTLSVLGLAPALGRDFTAEEGQDYADVVMLDHDLWQRRFGGDDSVLGSTILLDGTEQQVVGILPAGLVLPQDLASGRRAAVWWPRPEPMPVAALPPQGGPHGYLALARLADGATIDRARAELAALNERSTAAGEYTRDWRFRTLVVTAEDEVTRRIGPAVGLLTAAALLLLLIACANLTSLSLSQALRRHRELAVRLALGAGRGQLARLVLAESLLVALAGGALGLWLAVEGLALLQALAAEQVPRLAEASLSPAVVGFTLAVSIAVALLAGLIPALWAARKPAQTGLRGGPGGGLEGGAGGWTRTLVVAFQVALAVVLLTGTGLMLRTVDELLSVDTGFAADGVTTFDLYLPRAYYPEPAHVTAFYQRALERLGGLPGVQAAGAIRLLPLASEMGDFGITVEGYEPAAEEQPSAEWQSASAGYFESLRIPQVEGRGVLSSDDAEAPLVMVVNRTFAETYWPKGRAVGHRVRLGRDGSKPWTEVVGVVGDVAHEGLTAGAKPRFYLPQRQFHLSTGFASRAMSVVVRSDPAHPVPAAAIRQALGGLDPRLAVSNLRPLEEVVRRAAGPSRLATHLLVPFATLALLLAAVGSYGVTAAVVAQRRREVGIRIALGARPGQAVGLMLGRGAGAVAIGLAAGTIGALLLTGVLARLLYGIGPRDPLTLVAAPLLIAAVALLAAYLPARSAARLDPRSVLQEG